jgi:o-succinylbenzoate---CoA ligase
VLDVPTDGLDGVLQAVKAALDGSGPPILPVPPASDPRRDAVLTAAAPDTPLEIDDVAVVLATGGSTGTPKCALLTRQALAAAAERQTERLGGPGLWLLALPAWHAGGLQVLVRAILGGVRPLALDVDRTFTAEAFDDATTQARKSADAQGIPLYVSLVPTQLSRLVAAGSHLLTAYDRVLVGSAAAPPGLLEGLRRDGVRLLESYGMSETCGGYAYDGLPIRDVDVLLSPSDDRITIGGPTLFSGYRLRPDLTAEALVDGRLLTQDVGRWTHGRLTLRGRVDDVILTGGEKIAPGDVVELLLADPDIGEAVVLGVPDLEWGQAVVAYVVPAGPPAQPNPDDLRARVRLALGRAAVPRRIHVLTSLPMQASGKIDRTALTALDTSYDQRA